ncbi:hydrogenase nickel incorporation protein HypB [Neolewinella lacunae]|uniref:Hydrogenase nickel incorporation protein HypB n=1 Tax=Neolewinella lacunae TaxID=1517758 RepID=A0A923PMD9_9BACT|nr:hydrogenase nickel incorporation protein HypB [Neolewinella lacunae]MBC6995105.1 hydrogenase nickel incorporation protein HypB [Neolewinella lacunae]MDN3634055.1 hydrogenase nickel incorporation protein HypB [Neolewinella lacunae]
MAHTQKSNRMARGTVNCDNTTMHLLKANDFMAEQIRKQVAARNILLINMTSSPGSGKTSLLQETARRIGDRLKIKVLVGDLETERDADRLREVGLDALQIVTGGICHLEAQMVWQAMDNLDLEGTDVLIVENVGNLVCPAAFDLGEDYRVTLIATTEGDDKPKKYPRMFLTSEMMVISKCDLLPYLPFSVEAVIKDARDINPDLAVLEVSSLKGEGMEEWCQWLIARAAEKKANALTTA